MLIVGSATLVKSLMETELIDEYRFLVQPIIIGRGKRFFKDGMDTWFQYPARKGREVEAAKSCSAKDRSEVQESV